MTNFKSFIETQKHDCECEEDELRKLMMRNMEITRKIWSRESSTKVK